MENIWIEDINSNDNHCLMCRLIAIKLLFEELLKKDYKQILKKAGYIEEYTFEDFKKMQKRNIV